MDDNSTEFTNAERAWLREQLKHDPGMDETRLRARLRRDADLRNKIANYDPFDLGFAMPPDPPPPRPKRQPRYR
jgi:hypothetical protein